MSNIAKQFRWGLFKTLTLQEIFEDSKSTSGGILCILGTHTFVSISWICTKQTSDSHSSIESEIISLDAGLKGHAKKCVERYRELDNRTT